MALTKDDVFSAASSLVDAGEKPTLEAVRKITGGSYTTISPWFTAWKSIYLNPNLATPNLEPAPKAISDRLGDFGREMWDLALEIATSRLQSERDSLGKERIQLELDRNEATELADRLSFEIEDVRSKLITSQNLLSDAVSQVATTDIQLAKAIESGNVATARADEIELRARELRAELDTAHKEASDLRAQVADLVALTAKHEIAFSEQSEKNALAARITDERLAAALSERDRFSTATSAAREEVARLTGQLEMLQKHSDALLLRVTPTNEKKKA